MKYVNVERILFANTWNRGIFGVQKRCHKQEQTNGKKCGADVILIVGRVFQTQYHDLLHDGGYGKKNDAAKVEKPINREELMDMHLQEDANHEVGNACE